MLVVAIGDLVRNGKMTAHCHTFPLIDSEPEHCGFAQEKLPTTPLGG